MRPLLLVADPDVRGRLWTVDALRAGYSIETLSPGEAPLRAARRVRPRLMLLGVPRGRANEAIRTCKMVKTDSVGSPLVGLLDPWCRLARPQQSVSRALADGYLGGQVSVGALQEFVQALIRGDKPIQEGQSGSGFVQKLLRRH